MNRHDEFADRLAGAARRAPLPDDPEPPVGFTTRILTRLREPRASLWEKLALRAVPVGALAALACVLLAGKSESTVPGDPQSIAQLMLEIQLVTRR